MHSVLYTRALISVLGLVLLPFWIKKVAIMLDKLFIINFNFPQLLNCHNTCQPLSQTRSHGSRRFIQAESETQKLGRWLVCLLLVSLHGHQQLPKKMVKLILSLSVMEIWFDLSQPSATREPADGSHSGDRTAWWSAPKCFRRDVMSEQEWAVASGDQRERMFWWCFGGAVEYKVWCGWAVEHSTEQLPHNTFQS